MFLDILNSMAPMKTVRIKQRSETWINEDILKAIRSRNASYMKFKLSKDQSSFQKFKGLRNEVNRMVTKAKKDFFSEKILECRKEPRKLWKCLKELG